MTVDTNLLIKISELYYLNGLTQSQISKELHIHRSTISRSLSMAREKKIVEIKINYKNDSNKDLKNLIKNKYNLKYVVFIDESDKQASYKEVNHLFSSILHDNMIVGLSWGRAMALLPKYLSSARFSNITCIPLIGGPSGIVDSSFHVNTIVYNVASSLHANSLLLDAPAFPNNDNVKKLLLDDPFCNKIFTYWKKMDIAIFGIGSPLIQKSTRWKEFYKNNTLNNIKTNIVAGDIVSRFFDKNGHQLKSPLDNSIIGIELEQLKKIPMKICIATTSDKLTAIQAAIKGNLIDALIINEDLGLQLL